MLERILTELRAAPVPLSLKQLSQMAQIEPAILEGMLLTLERKGRIVTLDTSHGENVCVCHSCPIQTVCPPEQKWYALANTQNAVGK